MADQRPPTVSTELAQLAHVLAPLAGTISAALLEASATVCSVPVDEAWSACGAPEVDREAPAVELASWVVACAADAEVASEAICELRAQAASSWRVSPVHAAVVAGCNAMLAGDDDAAVTWHIEAANRLVEAGASEQAAAVCDRAAEQLSGEHAVELREHAARAVTNYDFATGADRWAACAAERERLHGPHANETARARVLAYWPALRDEHRHLLEAAATTPDSEAGGWVHRARALASTLKMDVDDAIAADRYALEHARLFDDVELEVLATRSLVIHMWDSSHEIHLGLCDHAASLAELHGFFGWAIEVEMMRIDLLLYEGSYGSALECAQRVLGHVTRRKLHSWVVDVTVVTAVLHRAVGRFTEASRYFEELDKEFGSLDASDLGRTIFVAALNAIDLGVSAAEVHAMFHSARQLGADSYERYRAMIEFGERRLIGREQGILRALEDLELPESVDISIATEMPLWLARSGTLEEEPEAVRCAARAIESFAPKMASDQRAWNLTREEVELHVTALNADASVTDLNAMFHAVARKWDELGCHIDALRARLSGLVLQSRSSSGDSLAIARKALSIGDEFRQLGAMADLEMLGGFISGVDDGTLTRVSRALDSSRAFLSISPQAKRDLMQLAVEFSLPAAQSVCERGERPEAFYLLSSGGVRSVVIEDGRELTIDVLGPGDVFGLLQPDIDVSPAQIETTEPTTVIALSPSQVVELRHRHTDFATAIDRELEAQRMRAHELAVELAYTPVPQRLARLICRLDERFGHPRLQGSRIINRRITQGDLATMIGATRKSVALILGDMRTEGIIDIDRKRIVILDAAALDKMARSQSGS